ncbi:MAG TPA: FtsX-like permease family protein [Burkholderiales bacterium]|nr:FtsX-like permease family protein [Burkholderiales bacterium]
MYLIKLVIRNAMRHKLRTGLTLLGIVVAILAFGLLRTVVNAWYAGAESTSAARLITRNAISLVFPLPITYGEKIRKIEGVAGVSHANWFGGVYISEKNFFPQLAIEASSYLDLYPEYILPEDQKKAFLLDRKGAIIGKKLADQFGWRVGDTVPLRGTIFPGNWSFTIRGIYRGAEQKTDTSQFFFHWDYLNETLKRTVPRRANYVGLYIVALNHPEHSAEVSQEIDKTFKNSLAETLTETEKAFQLSFVEMTEAILVAIQIVSFVIIAIIMAVMANTMAMTARERAAEYATIKALGFAPPFLAKLIFGESLAIAALGGAAGIVCTFPVANAFGNAMGALFKVFYVSWQTVAVQIAAALLVGAVAAILPAWRASRVKIADGLRNIG